MELLPSYLTSLIPRLPVLLVWLVGLLIAIIRWQRHPRVSVFATISFVLLVANSLAGAFLSIWLPFTMVHSGMPASRVSLIYGIVGLLQGLASAAAYALLLVALFGGRKKETGEEITRLD